MKHILYTLFSPLDSCNKLANLKSDIGWQWRQQSLSFQESDKERRVAIVLFSGEMSSLNENVNAK